MSAPVQSDLGNGAKTILNYAACVICRSCVWSFARDYDRRLLDLLRHAGFACTEAAGTTRWRLRLEHVHGCSPTGWDTAHASLARSQQGSRALLLASNKVHDWWAGWWQACCEIFANYLARH